MCPSNTTTANIIEKPRKIKRNFLLFQNIKAKRNGKPVCPEKKRSLPEKIPLKTPVLNTEFITIWVGKALMCVRVTKIDLIKVKRPTLSMIKGVQLGFLIPIKRPINNNKIDPYTKIPL